jgi:hypothetical protein
MLRIGDGEPHAPKIPAIAAFPIDAKTLYGAARLCLRQSQIID